MKSDTLLGVPLCQQSETIPVLESFQIVDKVEKLKS